MKKTITTLFALLFIVSGSLSAQVFCEAAFEYETDLVGTTVAYYNASFSNSAPIVGYSWDFGANIIANEENPLIEYPEPGVYLTCLSIFTADSCVSTYCDSLEVGGGFVEPNCAAYIEFEELGQGTYQFYGFADGQAPFTYTWNFSDGNIATGEVITYSFPPNTPGVYDVSLSISDALGCTADQTITIFADDSTGTGGGTDCFSVEAGLSPYPQEDPTFQQVIAADSWCCENGWDDLCQTAYDNIVGGVDTVGIDTTGCNAFFGYEVYMNPATGSYNVDLFPNDPNQGIDWNVNAVFSPNGYYSFDAEPGTYEVCLTVSSFVCSDTYCEEIVVGENMMDCSADFDFEFDNASLYLGMYAFNEADEYNWVVFGPNGGLDSLIATDQYVELDNPVAGIYEVCLSVIDGDCYDYQCNSIVLGDDNSGDDCSAVFGVQYWMDPATGLYNIDLYPSDFNQTLEWNVDAELNATGIYSFQAEAGTYEICLTAYSDSCNDGYCETIVIEEEQNTCNAEFGVEYGYNETTGLYNIWLYPYNPNTFLSYNWNLPVEVSPNGGYYLEVEAGVYDICLTVSYSNCEDETCQTITLDQPVEGACTTITNGSSPYGEDDATFQAVIAQDSYCCNNWWDGICQSQYDGIAGDENPGTPFWPDSLGCMTVLNGSAPYGEDDATFQAVIAQDSWCCDTGWDALCQAQYDELNGTTVSDNTTATTICGDVFGGSPEISLELSGTVYLIAFDPVNLTLTALQSYEFSAGDPSFCFDLSADELNEPILYLKAALNEDSPYYDNLLPTYYDGGLMWYNADFVFPGDEYTIYLSPGVNDGGPGFIGGSILDGIGKTAADAEGIPVMLLNLDRTPVAFIMTDADGNYQFDGIPYGTYQLIPDVWGQRIDPIIITISEETPSVTDAAIEVELAVEEPNGLLDLYTNATSLNVYPNPTKDAYQFRLESTQAQNGQATLYNVLGEAVSQTTLNLTTGVNTIQQNTNAQAVGVYFLEIALEDGTRFSSKIVKE